MKLLIVDDDESQRERYNDSISEYNLHQDTSISPVFKTNLESGLKALSDDYDGAVVDLKLTAGSNEAEGNLIIKQIKKEKRFPVCVVTGYPNDLDADLQEEMHCGPNLFFWLEKRDRPFRDVLGRLTTIHNSGVLEIVRPHGIIEETINTIFWTHLAKVLGYWNTQTELEENRKQRLLRFTLSLLLHKLEVADDGRLDNYYPEEMYIVPHARDDLQTGDIVLKTSDDSFHVVVTPACDLAQKKAKSIQIIPVEPLSGGLVKDNLNLCRKQIPTDSNNEAVIEHERIKLEATEVLTKLAANSYSNKYHFLPPCESFRGGTLNFQKVQSIPISEFPKSFKRAGTISASFLKDIVSRFAAYYARQGQPNLECDKIVEKLIGQ